MNTAAPPTPAQPLVGKTVVLGICGGIAAYKAAELTRLLHKAGAAVHVIMTAAAQQFITPLTLQTLSGQPVTTDLFDLTQESEIGHIGLADRADLLLVAPATADILARLALGLGDDVLTTVALACRAPLLLCPAMNVNMWEHPQVQENLGRLVARGARTCGPDAGPLACGWIGKGRLVDPQVIADAAAEILLGAAAPATTTSGTWTAPAVAAASGPWTPQAAAAASGAAPAQATAAAGPSDLRGVRLLVTAGPTYEPIDPVRFLGNRSSGKMGFALAAAAARRGALVTLVAGPVALPTPDGVRRVDIESAAEMAEQVLPAVEPGPDQAEVIIMAAAVADYRPQQVAAHKLKKGQFGEAPQIALSRTLDILAELGRRRHDRRPLLVGFAAETHAVEEYALRKLTEKGCDLIVANDVSEPGSGFGTDTNRVVLISPAREVPEVAIDRLPLMTKAEVADHILDRIAGLLVRGIPG